MHSDIATYVVAKREGVPIHKYLDAETLERVEKADQHLRATELPHASHSGSPSQQSRVPTRGRVVEDFPLQQVKLSEASLSAARKKEAFRMATIYQMLYAFENSIREFVDGHLTTEYGPDWWNDTKIVGKRVRETVERNKSSEAQHRYHSRRTARPIYYTNLGDLATITVSENGWKVFKHIFPSDGWLASLVMKVETSRNVVAHMNPVQKKDITRIELNFEDWLEQINGYEPA